MWMQLWARFRTWLEHRHHLVLLTVKEVDARRLAAYDAGYAQATVNALEEEARLP